MYTRSRGPPRGGSFRTPPVKVGEELDVSIEAVGEKGDGIATKNGFVLFVPGVKVGDKVRIRVTKVLSKVGFAEVVTGAAAPAGESEESAEAKEAFAEEDAAEEETEDSEDFGEEVPVAPEDNSSSDVTEESEDSGEVSEESGGESYSDEE